MAKRNGLDDRRVKLLVGIIAKEDEIAYTDACNACCTALHVSGLCNGTARTSYLSYFGLDEIEKRIIFTLIPDTSEKAVLASIGKKLRLALPGRGVAFTAPLSGISSLISGAILNGAERTEKNQPKTKKEKKTMHELVVAVVQQKFSDLAVEAAREAGATGGTILHTRTVNNRAVEGKLGTTLKQETETLTFLTTKEYKGKIMEAVRDVAGLKTEGGAVIFSLPVDEVVGIGAPDEEEE